MATFEINNQSNNSYPFVTKAQVKARLESDPDFRREALLVLYRRQTEDEREAKDTVHKNRRGFMSSHAVHGTRIAELLLMGESISLEDESRIEAITGRYTKQLCEHYRAEQISELDAEEAAKVKATFGV